MTQLHEQWMLSSCTQRLLQIQQQLQQHNRRQLQQQLRNNIRNQEGKQVNSKLSQQLISSVVMKQQAQRQLAQQQNLLIHYLKQQLYHLSTSNTHYQRLLSSIDILNKQCLQLQKCKTQQQQSQQCMLQKAKREYRQLQQLLPVLTTQSTVNYELVLRLRQRNSVTKRLLEEKGVTKQQMQNKYDQLTVINNNNLNQHTQLQSTINKTQSMNAQLSKTITNKSSQLQTNTQKLQQLQEEIRRYQVSNQKFRHIQQVAKGDNFKLRQQLMRRREIGRRKEQVLGRLNRQREACVVEKQSLSSNLQHLIAQSHLLKQKFNSITQSTLQSLQRLSQLQVLHDQHTHQLTTLHNTLSKLSHLKTLTLFQCNQKQQQLQKQLYFIQQYINVNRQLISQIQIVIKQGERKKCLGRQFIRDSNNSNTIDGNLFIDRLRSILMIAKQQLSSIHFSHCSLLKQFQSYQIHHS